MHRIVVAILSVFLLPNVVFGASTLQSHVQGRILLDVESHGEAWYVNPVDSSRYYMKDGPTAYEMMRYFGLGISESDFLRLESGDKELEGRLKGRIVLRVQAHGEAYYVHPDGGFHYLKDGAAAYSVMRGLSLGIRSTDLEKVVSKEMPDKVKERLVSPKIEALIVAPVPQPVSDSEDQEAIINRLVDERIKQREAAQKQKEIDDEAAHQNDLWEERAVAGDKLTTDTAEVKRVKDAFDESKRLFNESSAVKDFNLRVEQIRNRLFDLATCPSDTAFCGNEMSIAGVTSTDVSVSNERFGRPTTSHLDSGSILNECIYRLSPQDQSNINSTNVSTYCGKWIAHAINIAKEREVILANPPELMKVYSDISEGINILGISGVRTIPPVQPHLKAQLRVNLGLIGITTYILD